MQELQSLKAQEGNDQAKVAIDAKKVEIDAYKAETDRLKVELEAQAAQQVIPQEPQQTVQSKALTSPNRSDAATTGTAHFPTPTTHRNQHRRSNTQTGKGQ